MARRGRGDKVTFSTGLLAFSDATPSVTGSQQVGEVPYYKAGIDLRRYAVCSIREMQNCSLRRRATRFVDTMPASKSLPQAGRRGKDIAPAVLLNMKSWDRLRISRPIPGDWKLPPF